MKKWLKIVISVVVVTLLTTISFFVGGTLGFMSGFEYRTALVAGVEGVTKVSILKALRQGRVDDAIGLLEIALDANIIEHSLLGDRQYAPFDFFRVNQYDAKFMVTIAKYRKKYLTDQYLEPFVHEILSKYDTKVQE